MDILKANPLVSIVMSAYNAEKYIGATIDTVLIQTYENWEFIIVNDGSIDHTQEILEAYALKDSRIKVINQVNQGQAAGRNNGFKVAKAFWIAYLDSDDLWHPTKLEKQVQVAAENPNCDVIFTEGWNFYNDDLNQRRRYSTQAGHYDNVQFYRAQLDKNIITVCSILVKRTLIELIGGWNEDAVIQGCEDFDYWFRMARSGANFICLPEQLFYYRIHTSNFSKKRAKMIMAEASVLVKNYDPDLIKRSGGSLAFQLKLNYRIQQLMHFGETQKVRVILERWNSISPTLLSRLSTAALNSLDGKGLLFAKLFLKLERGKLSLASKMI
jgi:teichuronic acid biosynthesis glycosyltransferase TuaG